MDTEMKKVYDMFRMMGTIIYNYIHFKLWFFLRNW